MSINFLSPNLLKIYSLTLFINYNDDFYTYALENDYLKALAETLRFKDIYTDAPKETLGNDDFDISVSKPIHKEIIDVEKLRNLANDVRKLKNQMIDSLESIIFPGFFSKVIRNLKKIKVVCGNLYGIWKVNRRKSNK